MEYTFRNTPQEVPTTLVLSEYALVIRRGKVEKTVPYAAIQHVKLQRDSSRSYQAALVMDGVGSLHITNKFHSSEKTMEDKSRAYSTFIRVLHFHMKDKSKATYSSATKGSRIWLWFLIAMVVSFAISFVADYFQVGLLNPFIQGLILAALVTMVILGANMNRWPRQYQPTDIPMEFLP